MPKSKISLAKERIVGFGRRAQGFKWLWAVELIFAVYALSENSLTVLEWGYKVDVPLVKYLFAVLQSVDGWGVTTVFMAAGLGILFYTLRDETLQKNGWIRALCAFFAVMTVVGISYYETDSWHYIIHVKLQLCLAVTVMLGYYFTYKNCIALGQYVVRKADWLTRCEVRGRAERFLFENHPFAGPLLLISLFTLPFVVSFFPGTLMEDAFEQLWRFFVDDVMNGHHPIVSTNLMGYCMTAGRELFHSDSMGIFLYTFPQVICQVLVFSYSVWLISKLGTPLSVRWGALLYFTVFPFFQLWGYTLVKDTGYYICTLLFITALMDILREQGKGAWWKAVLFIVGSLGMATLRNNGRYVIVLSLFFAFFMYRKKWKLYLTTLLISISVITFVEHIYMPMKGIEAGEVGEALSIPLQQTARYIKTHYAELTEEETEILESLFEIDLADIEYLPEISDPVKGLFPAQPTAEQYKDYFRVWWQQLLKHPATYVQAFLHQTYGYFYIDRKDAQGSALCVTKILGRERLDPEEFHFDIAFLPGMKNARALLKESTKLVSRMPVVGMLFSAGAHVYMLLGCLTYLLIKKRYREILLLIPSLCMVLICVASPVNAKLRYVLPIMVALPLNIAWCNYVGRESAPSIVHDKKSPQNVDSIVSCINLKSACK